MPMAITMRADPQRQWTKSKTLVHSTLVDAVARFCNDCGKYRYRGRDDLGSDSRRR